MQTTEDVENIPVRSTSKPARFTYLWERYNVHCSVH